MNAMGMIRSYWLDRSISIAIILMTAATSIAAEPEVKADQRSQAIELYAIVEAPIDKVWPMLATPQGAARWMWNKTVDYEPRTGGRYVAVMHGGDRVGGRVFKVTPRESVQLTWMKPATMVTFELRTLDEHLTMVTIKHEGFSPKVPEMLAQMLELRLRWTVSLMKLHQQFPPPVVDTKRYRPVDAKGLFIERSLIVNGDFHYNTEPSRYEGVAFGWETNTAKASPKTHRLDTKISHTQPGSQVIANPPDWTNFAVQQFTSHLSPLITPGKRYRLTGWVKTDGIRNPAGWYMLGLWYTDIAGKPIGDTIKNEKLIDAKGETLLSYDWHKFTIEAVAPPNAARAVIILPGHWDDGGTVWYDDIQLWEAEKITTKSTKMR